MEESERPTKLRKLSHDNAGPQGVEQSPTQPQHDAMSGNGQVSKMADQEKPSQAGEQRSEPVAKDESDGDDGGVILPTPSIMAPRATEIPGTSTDPPISKNALKRLKKKAEWEAKREDRKVLRKDKLHKKRERQKAEKQQKIAEGVPPPVKQKREKADQLPVTVIIDCDFDELMHDGERISLASQITRCYSDNKNSTKRAHITIASFKGELRKRFDTVLERNYDSWRGVRVFDENFLETAEKAKEWMAAEDGGVMTGSFSKYANLDDDALQKLKDEGEVVYLSSEADEDLMELKPFSTYIIGGLVDKNREKGICHKRATKAGVRTAKLPIGEYMELQSRKVLATNHVNEIMVKWLECGDWGEAFMKAIPKRKGGKLRGENDEDDQNGASAEQAEGEHEAVEQTSSAN
ncbi:tRNA (guanine(9)-N1)-methyltransferase [Fulvia fulva]|uniref:tRNA (guanine(9)-N1)-methyltransferase n=1 Tax=Passalora fulva TaxID=5499 RepID=A0A9Q8PJ46_PASFU|nr:tRNA (guanine(9)-N1)-methyltransferase [Fulvia fulva]KAK4611673.1 tRNA (guanine(9)-N1)-methyltransferase [Fulvia fulva]KAK4612780.1 tRNA (guanine(9)-N1)-methyltransferase [Fulvia fulva]UJO23594.1 tRNA (guanine(9)-N1)-methyltransferase [Fulvia fulva]WPV20924.1 tRNA (guanine(9)-N1)-methyltransferase [Fulvia fulva]WPV35903.1 tRNA (guanine(9)-N1)-methyltransferase [Fulvia fulva]